MPVYCVSVGRNGLLAVSQVLSMGIRQKHERSSGEKTDIIVAENPRDADLFMRKEMMKHLH